MTFSVFIVWHIRASPYIIHIYYTTLLNYMVRCDCVFSYSREIDLAISPGEQIMHNEDISNFLEPVVKRTLLFTTSARMLTLRVRLVPNLNIDIYYKPHNDSTLGRAAAVNANVCKNFLRLPV